MRDSTDLVTPGFEGSELSILKINLNTGSSKELYLNITDLLPRVKSKI